MITMPIYTSSPYNVLIDSNILGDTGELLKENTMGLYSRIAVITDSNVGPLYSKTVMDSLKKSGHQVYSYVFPAGETSKTMDNTLRIISWLIENQFSRTDLLVALGGGVCGDLVGFVAAIFLRGIDFVQIPTTLLAAVDSSVGGKTAVNISEGKNLVGCFWQPKLVICDISTLSTLKAEDYSSGVAEVVKYGCIWDKDLFERLKKPNWNQKDTLEIIGRCVEIKAEIVSQDEREGGIRAILNWGHTLGHAVEKLSGYSVSHGQAVAIGMCLMAKAGEAEGLSKTGTADSIKEVLSQYNLPTSTEYSYEALATAALSDKKRTGDFLTLIVLTKIGTCKSHKIPLEELKAFVMGGV